MVRRASSGGMKDQALVSIRIERAHDVGPAQDGAQGDPAPHGVAEQVDGAPTSCLEEGDEVGHQLLDGVAVEDTRPVECPWPRSSSVTTCRWTARAVDLEREVVRGAGEPVDEDERGLSSGLLPRSDHANSTPFTGRVLEAAVCVMATCLVARAALLLGLRRPPAWRGGARPCTESMRPSRARGACERIGRGCAVGPGTTASAAWAGHDAPERLSCVHDSHLQSRRCPSPPRRLVPWSVSSHRR